MKIGIAIPCYKPHITVLKRCLDSIEQQTIKPTHVVVSCSSSDAADIPQDYFSYSFPVQILTHKDRKNAAENRNIAAEALEASATEVDKPDLISFFDADDVMHPQRLEAISKAFQQYPQAKLLLHSFILPDEEDTFQPITEFEFNYGVLQPSSTIWCAEFKPGVKGDHIHHSQITVRTSLTHLVQFNTDARFERREDSDYAARALVCVKGESIYCPEKLSKYYRAGDWIKI